MERLLEWNKQVPPSLEECIHQIVQSQVDLQPDAPAICSWDVNLTYRELDELAARLAGQLVDLGVAAEVNVPLCLEKSAWAIVAELAVLKAGGVCVPLDPARPAVQNEAILRNVQPIIILASYGGRYRPLSQLKMWPVPFYIDPERSQLNNLVNI
jgi:non-ribosomal peptide synthetase component F